MTQDLSAFKKLEKNYMHYKVKLLTLASEWTTTSGLVEVGKRTKMAERLDRVLDSYQNVMKFKVAKEALTIALSSSLETLKKISENKSNVGEELLTMLSNDLFDVFSKSFKSRISEFSKESLPQAPMKIMLSQAIQCNLLDQNYSYGSPVQTESNHLKVPYKIKESTMMESGFEEYNGPIPKIEKSDFFDRSSPQEIAEGFVKKTTFGANIEEPKEDQPEKKEDLIPTVKQDPPQTKAQPVESTSIKAVPIESKDPKQEALKEIKKPETDKEDTKKPEDKAAADWQLTEKPLPVEEKDVEKEVAMESKPAKEPSIIERKKPERSVAHREDSFVNPWLDSSIPEYKGQPSDFFGDSGTQQNGNTAPVNFFDFGDESTKAVDAKPSNPQVEVLKEKKIEQSGQGIGMEQGFKKKEGKKEIVAGDFDGFFGNDSKISKAVPSKEEQVLKPLEMHETKTAQKQAPAKQKYEDYWDFDEKVTTPRDDSLSGPQKPLGVGSETNFFEAVSKESPNDPKTTLPAPKAEARNPDIFSQFETKPPHDVPTALPQPKHESVVLVHAAENQSVPHHTHEQSSKQAIIHEEHKPFNPEPLVFERAETPIQAKPIAVVKETEPVLDISHGGMIGGGVVVGFNDFENASMSMSLIDHQPIGPQSFLDGVTQNPVTHESPKGVNETELLKDLWQPSMAKQTATPIEIKVLSVEEQAPKPKLVSESIGELQNPSKPQITSILSDMTLNAPLPVAEKRTHISITPIEEDIFGLQAHIPDNLQTPKDSNLNLFVFDDLVQQQGPTHQSVLSRDFLTSSHVSLAPFPVMDDLVNMTTEKIIASGELKAQPQAQKEGGESPILPSEPTTNLTKAELEQPPAKITTPAVPQFEIGFLDTINQDPAPPTIGSHSLLPETPVPEQQFPPKNNSNNDNLDFFL